VRPIEEAREDFPIFRNLKTPLVYLDSAATAQKPDSVLDAMNSFYKTSYGTVHRAIYKLSREATDLHFEARKTVASFIGAGDSSEVIFTRGTTDSINLVRYTFGKRYVQQGDEILITELEHHSNIVPWQLLCEEVGAKLVVAPVAESGELILSEYKNLLSSRTRLVSFPHIANTLGVRFPVEEMTRLAKSAGAAVLVDGAQGICHDLVDVKKWGVDFYAFSGHKLYGPTGIGVLYGRKELLDQLPPFEGGGDMIDKVTFEKTTYGVPPLKFEAGTPMIAEVIGLKSAIEYVNSWGIENIARYEKMLTELLVKKMSSIAGVRILGGNILRTSIVPFIVEGIHPLDLGTFLDLKGVAIRTGHLCAQPALRSWGFDAIARASLAIYNTKEDIDYFVSALQSIKEKF